jgi:hypothetical protein
MNLLKNRIYLLLLLSVILTGCATSTTQTQFMSISRGMTKQEVIAIMGPPLSMSATPEVEDLIYNISPPGVLMQHPDYNHFVRFVDGKVYSYGKMGYKNPDQDISIKIQQK